MLEVGTNVHVRSVPLSMLEGIVLTVESEVAERERDMCTRYFLFGGVMGNW